jgi:hypothetical protein
MLVNILNLVNPWNFLFYIQLYLSSSLFLYRFTICIELNKIVIFFGLSVQMFNWYTGILDILITLCVEQNETKVLKCQDKRNRFLLSVAQNFSYKSRTVSLTTFI